MKRFSYKLFKIALLLAICLFGIWLTRFFWLPFVAEDPSEMVRKKLASGGALLDRKGKLLRIVPDDNQDLFLYAPVASHSSYLEMALLTAEDRNFHSHSGFDLFAIIRAAWQNIKNFRVISGASTISQQVIRILKPRPRNLRTKLAETFSAMLLEQKYSKNEILELYYNFVPMFGNIRGFNLSSRLLFKKTPDLLNLSQAAALAAMVQSPGRLTPFSSEGNKRLRKRRDWIIREMLAAKQIDLSSAQAAMAENIPDYRAKLPFNAPHFCDLVINNRGNPIGNQYTTIALSIQNPLFSILKSHLPRLARSGARQACAMIVDTSRLEVLAMVGSAEFGPIASGFNNGCIARRSGGSILKPFLYSLALEQGYYPSFVLPDTMQPFKTPQGEYLPLNANRKDYGPVTIRTALGNSLNIAAVKMLNLLGIKDFFAMLTRLELLQPLANAANFYGLGLAIGNPEIRMIDLVKAYAIFANQGTMKDLSFFLSDPVKGKSVISETTAWLIYDILSDPSARLLTFGNPAFFKFKRRWALKTGTSTNYRDSWLVAFNKRFVFAVWVGNFDGSPTRSLSGAVACGPVAYDIAKFLDSIAPDSAIPMPSGIKRIEVCSISGQIPGKFCKKTGFDLYDANSSFIPICTFHKSDTDSHEVSADYARWIQKRSMFTDVDLFRLEGNLFAGDPYRLVGISDEPTIQPGQTTGTIKVGPVSLSSGFAGIKIVSPHEGDRFLMSSALENHLYLRAIPEKAIDEIVWLINGREYLKTGPPFEAYWPMKPGHYRITAVGPGEDAAEVNIIIEQ